MLLGSLLLLVDFSLTGGQSFVLNVKLVDLAFDLDLELIDRLHYSWVSFLEKLNVAAAVLSMNDTLWANRWDIAIEAEVLYFFLGVLTAHITNLSERLTYRSRD